jgi:hypothetical protein
MAIATEPLYILSDMKNHCSCKYPRSEKKSIKASDILPYILPYLPAPVGTLTRPLLVRPGKFGVARLAGWQNAGSAAGKD